jgi:predicted transcriptional regulator
MNTAIEHKADSIEHCYLQQHMSGDQVAAYLGLSQYQVKKYLLEKGITRTRQEATSQAARTMRQKAANNALSAYDLQEQRESRSYSKTLSLLHKRVSN